MMYGYLTLSDGTGIAHSEMKPDGSVKVYFEKPVEGGFQHATCYLPDYRWEKIEGFSGEDQKRLDKILHDKYAGVSVKDNGDEYLILKMDDILAILG